MKEYNEVEGYISKEKYEKVVKENEKLKKERDFIQGQLRKIFTYCQDVIKIL